MKYSSSPTISWKLHRAFGIHPDPFISLVLMWAKKLLPYKLGESCSPDHGSLPLPSMNAFRLPSILHDSTDVGFWMGSESFVYLWEVPSCGGGKCWKLLIDGNWNNL